MAKLNDNAVLCNVLVNDNVVAGGMGIESQRNHLPAAALLSQGWPDCAGPEPTPMMREVTALVDRDYRDATRRRTGRSAVSPIAGGFVLPRLRPGHARHCFATAAKQHPAKKQGFALLIASATRQTSVR